MTTLDHVPSRTSPPHLRADAERNRKKILEVAARVFAERGIDATLNDIAHAAGVGVGTIYRKFADKNALIDELTEDKLQLILENVSVASEHESGAQALRDMMRAAAAMRARDRGLFGILFAAGTSSPVQDERIARLLHTWDAAIARAVTEGAVRPGFSPVDVDAFMLMVGTVADATHHIAPHAWERYADVLLDGFGMASTAPELAKVDLDDAQRRAIFLKG